MPQRSGRSFHGAVAASDADVATGHGRWGVGPRVRSLLAPCSTVDGTEAHDGKSVQIKCLLFSSHGRHGATTIASALLLVGCSIAGSADLSQKKKKW